MTYEIFVLILYLVVLLVMSLLALFLYKKDKDMSKGNTEVRIKEKTLLGVAYLGGGIGALIGRILFRHKTNKLYFSIVILLSTILQITCAIALVVIVFI